MKNILRVDFERKRIVMDRTFAKNCSNASSEEYAQLQSVRRDYPDYMVTTRTIARNSHKETYAGLTYEYMENYIIAHEKGDDVLEVLDEYNQLQLIAECHSKSRRYPVIKRWFLAKYPEIRDFGVLKIKGASDKKSEMELINCGEEKKGA